MVSCDKLHRKFGVLHAPSGKIIPLAILSAVEKIPKNEQPVRWMQLEEPGEAIQIILVDLPGGRQTGFSKVAGFAKVQIRQNEGAFSRPPDGFFWQKLEGACKVIGAGIARAKMVRAAIACAHFFTFVFAIACTDDAWLKNVCNSPDGWNHALKITESGIKMTWFSGVLG